MNRDELQITKDLLSAVNDQKRDLEYQNRELRDRIETVENSRLDIAQAAAGAAEREQHGHGVVEGATRHDVARPHGAWTGVYW